MGWHNLKHWHADAEVLEPLTGGVANDVRKVRLGEIIAVARLGTRSDADLNWETSLLAFLDENGLGVPRAIPTLDGRMFAEGLTVLPFIEGKAPRSNEDWKDVAAYLRRLHKLTADYEQRPGWLSSHDLLKQDNATRVDLTAMPQEGVERCRNAWSKISHMPKSVVHGDQNDRNILMTKQGVVMIDWDESRVDVSAFDLVLPHNAGSLSKQDQELMSQALSAWEAAVCWGDDYAKKRLAEVNPVQVP